MMEEQQYKKGFNHGYVLKANNTGLFETLSKGLEGDTIYKEGFIDGGEQYELEKRREMIQQMARGEQEKRRENGR